MFEIISGIVNRQVKNLKTFRCFFFFYIFNFNNCSYFMNATIILPQNNLKMTQLKGYKRDLKLMGSSWLTVGGKSLGLGVDHLSCHPSSTSTTTTTTTTAVTGD